MIRPSAIDGQMRDLPPWGDKEIARFEFRKALFIRRGIHEHYADQLADRLYERDLEMDTRRFCAECANYQRDGGCHAAKQGWITGADRRMKVIPDLLQRCECFKWQTPN